MKHVFIFVFYSLLFTNLLKASDTTELYRKRVQVINKLVVWLSKNARSQTELTGNYNSNELQFKAYENALSIFFNKVKIDSIIKNFDTTRIRLGPDNKTSVVKGLVARLNELAHTFDSESLKFKPYKVGEIHILFDEEIDINNSIVQYFLIDDEIVPYLLFTFKSGSSVIEWIDVSIHKGKNQEKLIDYFHRYKRKSVRRK